MFDVMNMKVENLKGEEVTIKELLTDYQEQIDSLKQEVNDLKVKCANC